jgi:hypothetical protein
MSLLKYAIAAAIGYYVGQPGGRRQVQQLSQKATELVRSPKAAELKDRGSKLVGERASAAVDKVRGKSASDPVTSGATTVSGTPTAGPASFTGGSAGGAGSASSTGSAGSAGSRGASDDLPTVQAGVLPPGPAPRAADEA